MLFHPSDYLALPGCLEEEEVNIGAGRKVKLDLAAVKLNDRLLKAYFKTLPAYQSWTDFLPFVDGNELLARMAVVIGARCGAWEIDEKESDESYLYPRIYKPSRVPKPSRGDLEEKSPPS